MSTKSVIKAIVQKGDKSKSAIYKAFDNANEVAAKANTTKNKKKK